MKSICLWVVTAILFSRTPVHGQFMAGTAAEGVSSLVGGKTLGFNLTKTSLRFDYTARFRNRPGEEEGVVNRHFTNFGFSLTGGNSSNIAALVTKGVFTPAGSVSGFIFHGWTLNSAAQTKILDQKKQPQAELKKLRTDFFTKTIKPKLDVLKKKKLDPSVLPQVQTAITNQGDNVGGLVADLNDIANDPATPPADKAILKAAARDMDNAYKANEAGQQITDLKQRINAIQTDFENFRRLNPHKRIVLFARAGTSATNYKYYNSLHVADFSKSFRDTVFTGPFGEIGVNLYSRSYLIWGLAAGILRNNTLQDASPDKVAIERTQTDALGQRINSKQEVTAYRGTYKQYREAYVKGDVVVLLPTSERGTFAINPYFRYSLISDDIAPNSLRMGINGYFFNHKGKFLGGLYVERNYTFTNVSANTFSVTRQGLDFGLRASFLFSTVFDTDKPDP